MCEPFFISVIIPVYNGADFLSEAIASIQQQNYQPLEIIIVDDGSTDDTAKIVATIADSVRYIYQPNQGAPAARNRGLEMACGDIITFLDADDQWCKNKLQLQLAQLKSQPATEIVIGHSQLLVSGIDSSAFEAFGKPWLFLNLASALFRNTAFDKVGLFDSELHQSDDLDWFMRAREMNISIAIHPEKVLLHRRHQHNITNQTAENNLYQIRMLKKSLSRRRSQHREVEPLPQFSELR